MTRKQMEEERDRMASLAVDKINLGIPIHASILYVNGFNAAMKLMEEKRVKPLREILEQATNGTTRLVVSSDTWHGRAKRALAKVEEWK